MYNCDNPLQIVRAILYKNHWNEKINLLSLHYFYINSWTLLHSQTCKYMCRRYKFNINIGCSRGSVQSVRIAEPRLQQSQCNVPDIQARAAFLTENLKPLINKAKNVVLNI